MPCWQLKLAAPINPFSTDDWVASSKSTDCGKTHGATREEEVCATERVWLKEANKPTHKSNISFPLWHTGHFVGHVPRNSKLQNTIQPCFRPAHWFLLSCSASFWQWNLWLSMTRKVSLGPACCRRDTDSYQPADILLDLSPASYEVSAWPFDSWQKAFTCPGPHRTCSQPIWAGNPRCCWSHCFTYLLHILLSSVLNTSQIKESDTPRNCRGQNGVKLFLSGFLNAYVECC